jgi:hypothetical protein
MAFVVLYFICKFVFLNRLVIVRINGLKYVKAVLTFVGCVVVILDLLIYSMNVLCGESIIFAVVCIVFHPRLPAHCQGRKVYVQ